MNIYRFCQFFLILITAGFVSTASAVDYFVNNSSTNGNVYTTAVGDDANSGTNSAAPMRNITTLLSSKDLEPGDRVFIDTGKYGPYTVALEIGDSGTNGNPVSLIGSTNLATGGTVIENLTPVSYTHLTLPTILRV